MNDIPIPRNRPDAPPEIVPGLFLQVAARFAQRLDEEACRAAPVHPPFLGVLFTIGANPGIRQGACAEALGFDATTFGRYIDRLVREGHVARAVPPEDRRAVSLNLTDAGAKVVAQCAPIIDGLEAEVRDRMGEADWALLTALLVRFLDAFDHPLPALSRAAAGRGE